MAFYLPKGEETDLSANSAKALPLQMDGNVDRPTISAPAYVAETAMKSWGLTSTQ